MPVDFKWFGRGARSYWSPWQSLFVSWVGRYKSRPTSWRAGILSVLPTVTLIFPLSTFTTQAQSKASDLTGIAHVALRVADLDKSREFYKKLGFEEAFAMDQGGTPTQSFFKINDTQFIELYPQRQPAQPIGFMHVCFESSDLEALNRFYVASGLSPIPVRRAGAGNLLFTLEGPERQNIEYTQYMPGSKHWNDRGNHLGSNRISEQIYAVGIEMQELTPARTFYVEKLGFSPEQSSNPKEIWLRLPGQSGQRLEIVQQSPGAAFQLFLSVADLDRAGVQLKALQIPFKKHKSMLSIQDPDGNQVIFMKAQTATK
jgi:catechol 2,3-dioxygenase-like lactoylglutathione lyase family enzyme